MKFVCYREFDDPEEPIHPGILFEGKLLPLAKTLAVSEAFHPQNLEIPDDMLELIGLLPTISHRVEELAHMKLLGKIWQELGVTLTAPLPRPNRVFGIGRNYAEHAKELGNDVIAEEPIVFLKASSTVIPSGSPIEIPTWAERVDFEGELAVVIGLPGRDIPKERALDHVAGYTIFNDVTERNIQKRDISRGLPWFRSKSLDTFGPLGPVIVTPDEIKDPQNLTIRTEVNGDLRQNGSTKDMIHSVADLIAFLSKYFTLESGDVIATGTPAGIGPIKPGDTVSITIDPIGTLTNPVTEAL
jgi:2-keto-4-pentenoate hydratase/2-oxohepta-3-ene-1,7-dioic acid hydratase in catechol pathway